MPDVTTYLACVMLNQIHSTYKIKSNTQIEP